MKISIFTILAISTYFPLNCSVSRINYALPDNNKSQQSVQNPRSVMIVRYYVTGQDLTKIDNFSTHDSDQLDKIASFKKHLFNIIDEQTKKCILRLDKKYYEYSTCAYDEKHALFEIFDTRESVIKFSIFPLFNVQHAFIQDQVIDTLKNILKKKEIWCVHTIPLFIERAMNCAINATNNEQKVEILVCVNPKPFSLRFEVNIDDHRACYLECITSR